MPRRLLLIAASVVTASALSACLWGMATIGGTLSGLGSGATVVLQNNGGNDLTLNRNGAFEFTHTVDENKSYNVTILTQPSGGQCSVANGSGTVDAMGTDVTNVQVTCVANASLTGTVTGLAAGTSLTLVDVSPDPDVTLVVSANGMFAFPGILSGGTAYDVRINTNPAGQTCSVGNGTGTVVIGTATNITVTCS